jgi:hypothetical protein
MVGPLFTMLKRTYCAHFHFSSGYLLHLFFQAFTYFNTECWNIWLAIHNNTRIRIFFFSRANREFFFQNLTLGYMTKTLNHIFFFSLHQNQNIFFSNIGNQNIFLENPTPPSSFTANVVSLNPAQARRLMCSIQHYVIKFDSGCLRVFQFPPPIQLTATI